MGKWYFQHKTVAPSIKTVNNIKNLDILDLENKCFIKKNYQKGHHMWFLGKMYERYAKVPFSLGPMGGVCRCV